MNYRVRWRVAFPSLISSVFVSALLATSANAHLVNTGLGPFYDGVSHVLLSPEDLIPVIAMGLLGGLNGPIVGRHTLFALTGAWLVAGVVGSFVAKPLLPAAVTTGSFLLLGTLTAADRRLSPAAVATLAVAIGVVHGWLNGAGTGGAKPATLGVLFGVTSAIFVLAAVVAAAAVATRPAWARVGFRVAGSWIAAIGLLMLGWELRKI
ncbi:MAG TPA: HupE/UreJ family protein [Hyphomicrobiaceae bacterium]